ncbi:hypothetical protein DFH06DRAFT_332447 [Mycena polygramma]|nr:hypothetical protein DFH06DRAFT_332447 [Mycena polygramma]
MSWLSIQLYGSIDVPADIVYQIFDWYCADSLTIQIPPRRLDNGAPTAGYTSGPVLLTHVSRRWREVACSHKGLWVDLAIHFGAASDRGRRSIIRRAQTYMERSRLLGLSLDISDADPVRPFNERESPGVCTIVRGVASRISSLRLSLDEVCYVSSWRKHVPFEFSGLVKLEMNVVLITDDEEIDRTIMVGSRKSSPFSKAKYLRSVTISGDESAYRPLALADGGPETHQVFRMPALFKWSTLSYFYGGDTWLLLADCSLVLHYGVNLLDCRLACQPFSEDDVEDRYDRLITLPKLRRLHLKYIDPGDHLLDIISAPNLSGFFLTILLPTPEWDPQVLMVFISTAATNLRTLWLRYVPLDSEQYRQLFTALPLLEELGLRWIRPSIRGADHMVTTMQNLRLIEGQPVLLPALRRIYIDATPISVRMLQSRLSTHAASSFPEVCSLSNIRLCRERRFIEWVKSEADSFYRCKDLVFSLFLTSWSAGTWRTPPSYIYSSQPQYDGSVAQREEFYQPLDPGDEDWSFLDN